MILIKMDMPKSCHDCPLQSYEYGCCDVPGGEDIEFYSSNKLDYWKTRDPKCPLIDFGEYMQDPLTKILQEYRER